MVEKTLSKPLLDKKVEPASILPHAPQGAQFQCIVVDPASNLDVRRVAGHQAGVVDIV